LIKNDPPVVNVRFEVKKVDFSDHYSVVLLFDDRRQPATDRREN